MEKDAELVPLQVLVPRDRIAEFYQMHSQWLRGSADPSPRPRLLALHEGDEPRTWQEGNEGERVADALIVYDKLSKGAKKIIDALVELPGEEISGENLASRLGLSGDQLTGTLASIGIRSKGVNRKVPFRYVPGPHSGTYCIESDVARLFRWVMLAPSTVEAGVPMNPLNMARGLDAARRELKDQRAWYDEAHQLLDFGSEHSAYTDLCNALEFEAALLAELLREAFNRETQVGNQRMYQKSPSQDGLEEAEWEEVPMAQSE